MKDLIDRQAAIDAAIEAADEWDGWYNITRANMIADAINNIAPSAQPERKKGKWINITNDESLEEEYECSVCGYELFYSKPTNFCPDCGADMREKTGGTK